MAQLMSALIPIVLLTLSVGAVADSEENKGGAININEPVVTKSNGSHRKNETLLAQSNARTIRTDHGAVAAKLARKPRHNSSFWDEFYSTEKVFLWVPVNYKGTFRRREIYRQYTGATSDRFYMQHLKHYQRQVDHKNLATDLGHDPSQDYAEWLYIMYRIDLDGLVDGVN